MEEIKQSSPSSTIPNTAANLPLVEEIECSTSDLVCLSHLRWDFVFQRPQHLLTRFARVRRVFYVEEPIFKAGQTPRMEIQKRENGLHVAVPHLPEGLDHESATELQKNLLDDMMLEMKVENFTLWYYTPMAMAFSRHLEPERVIYDCMDELSLFRGAPQSMIDMEQELIEHADHVFTGGFSLYEAKKNRHESVHAFPSSIDYDHFAKAREAVTDPEDQKHIPHPRIGSFGVIDERMDLELIEKTARLRPDWQLVIIGPVVKIDASSLPQLPNIHYLGMKSHQELPKYLANWDVAMMPFALNESTRFISPTKTPEYLAAGKPVVSTPIRDVIRPYGEEGLVHIAGTPEEFVAATELALKEASPDWLSRVDQFLARGSWDQTWAQMAQLESNISVMTVTITADPEVLSAAIH